MHIAGVTMSKSSKSIVELKDYVDTLATHIKEYVDTRFSASDEAVHLANAALQIRLDSLNHLYQQIQRMGDLYPNKSDLENLSQRYELQVKAYDTDIRYLRESKADIAGKASSESLAKVQENVSRSQTLVIIGLSLSLISLGCGAIGSIIAITTLIFRLLGM